MYDHLAICVKDVDKSYGSSHILKKLCIKVEKGIIYGLLGSSGCGKTTILSCIVGRNKVDDGDIWVMGEKVDGVPGAKVGYMPQELALISEFTVKDTIYFFGRIYDMNENLLREQYTKLKQLLELPDDNRLLQHCSGGEKRRISFAVALVHKPEILILDEPSVGADPILRDRIWKRLEEISKSENTTVIITTHYIEEARQAQKIGLMREGQLLVEDSPDNLMTNFNCETLEEVFLILSKNQAEQTNFHPVSCTENRYISSAMNNGSSTETFQIGQGSTDILVKEKRKYHSLIAGHRLRALMVKNLKQMIRNKILLIIIPVFPIIQILMFVGLIGRNITDIPLAIVNKEMLCSDSFLNETVIPVEDGSCHLNNISCRFLHYLINPTIRMKNYESVSEATAAVQSGKAVGVLYIRENLSSLIENRLEGDFFSDGDTKSEIQVWLDMSSMVMGGTLGQKIADLYQEFHESIYKDCHFQPKASNLPIRIQEIYGSRHDEFTIFMSPGFCVIVIFYLGLMMACDTILNEKCEGIWDRCVVAGVTSVELTTSHFIFQAIWMVIVTLEVITVVFVILQQESVGSIWIVFLILYLQALCGLVCGFWTSVVSSSHTMANLIITGIFHPLAICSGVFWPLEGMPRIMQVFSRCLMLSVPIESLRSVIQKDRDLFNLETISAIGILVGWSLFLGLVSVYIMKLKH